MRARSGYTLLEVLIAMAILAIALSVLLGTQSTSALMTERANRMAQSALLARSKMADIEHELLGDGFSDMEERMNGDFQDEGFPSIRWDAVVEVVEIPPEAAPEFAANINAQLFGDGAQGGALSGSTAVSQWMPMILAEVPNIINQMAERARFVTLTIEWDEGRHTQSLTIQQYVVNLNRGGAEGNIETLPMAGPGTVMAPGTNEAIRIR
jgi:general secretion pathway protein I